LKALSSGSLSVATRTVPRVLRAAGVKGANVTEAELFGSTDTRSVCTDRPSISSDNSTFAAGEDEWLVTPPGTGTGSSGGKVDRCTDPGVTLRFDVVLAVIGRGVNVTPSGSRTPSAPCQPLR